MEDKTINRNRRSGLIFELYYYKRVEYYLKLDLSV